VRFEFRVVGLHLAIGHREIETLEEIGWRFLTGAIWQAQAILLALSMTPVFHSPSPTPSEQNAD
jgi:hypothetical protein